MKQVYFDRNQCEFFEIPYFGDGSVSLRADVILSSKRQGYDSHHRDMLGPYGAQLLWLSKAPDDNPGWYTIVGLGMFRKGIKVDRRIF